MKRSYTQKEIYDFLSSNPLGIQVNIGDLEDMQGQDWIFLDYINDVAILSDDDGCYMTLLQITVFTRDFEDRKTICNYIKSKILSAPTYSKSTEFEYYRADFQFGVFLHEEAGSI